MKAEAVRDGQVGRVDLLLALADRGDDGVRAMARVIGYRERTASPETPAVETKEEALAPRIEPNQPRAAEAVASAVPETPTPFWRLEAIEEKEPSFEEPAWHGHEPIGADGLGTMPGDRPTARPIVNDARLWPVLHERLSSSVPSRCVDEHEITWQVGRGAILDRIPYRPLPALAPRITVLVDRSERLYPYWNDQARLLDQLSKQMPRGALRMLGYQQGQLLAWRGPEGRYRMPPVRAGEPILALTDLGLFGATRDRTMWRKLGAMQRLAGVRCTAVVPCPRDRWRPSVLRGWRAIDWAHPRRTRPSLSRRPERVLDAQADRLRALLSFAARIDPGLLREVRRLLPPNEADLGTEADAWASSPHRTSATSYGEATRDRLRAAFRTESEALKRDVVGAMRRWRSGLPREIWLDEVLALDTAGDLPAAVLGDGEIDEARRMWQRIAATVASSSPTSEEIRRGLGSFSRRSLHERAPTVLWQDPRLRPALWQAWSSAWRMGGRPPLPPGVGPEMYGSVMDEVQRWDLVQVGGALRVHSVESIDRGSPLVELAAGLPDLSAEWPGVRLARIHSLAALRIDLPRAPELVLRTDRSTATLRRVVRPPWADAMGRDRFGLWARFTVGGVSQRMRWIPPGSFWMGSPEREEGRHSDEGPRHRVEMEQGFWLAEVPCTQALWQVVMGDNPSSFQSPERPVENVSWEDGQRFLAALGACAPDLAPRLPFEAEWEYACRAGTETATYAGPMEIADDQTAAVLDAIAWYRGNSHEEFELEPRHGTHPVARKAPNPWGLHDMLGNVLEWCEDLWCYRYNQPRQGTYRVVRGGSWFYYARNVRAAFRIHSAPSVRDYYLGFRLARGPALQPGAEPDGDARASGGPGSRRSRRKGPTWARASGRDRFGEWAAIDIEGAEQRMRRILPGTFWMGSPTDEVGRWANEGPRHEVEIGRDFWIADTPCTQALWQAVMGENPSRFRSPDLPVERVSWNDCRKFLSRLGERIPGLDPRLPLEAEWEYACRAGTETATYAGSTAAAALSELAWFDGNADGKTHEVGKKRPNDWGLYDMLGNVNEWCEERWCDRYDQPPQGTNRVVRGGSWIDLARLLRAAYRGRAAPSDRYFYLGFRLARGPFALQQGAARETAEQAGSGASPRRSRPPRRPGGDK